MRSAARFAFVIATAAHLSAPVHAQTADDSLRVYAVNVVKTAPFENRFTGDGIYLGRGVVITAAHVVGNWPSLTHPHILVAGQDLPAKVIKEGSFEEVDLALLSVDPTRLPVSLQLRRNPLCQQAPKIGMEVVDVAPEETTRSQVISPLFIAPELRGKFGTLIDSPKMSGSGLFDAERKCLVGIMSAKVAKYDNQTRRWRLMGNAGGFAGYFVPAAKIANFIPTDVHY